MLYELSNDCKDNRACTAVIAVIWEFTSVHRLKVSSIKSIIIFTPPCKLGQYDAFKSSIQTLKKGRKLVCTMCLSVFVYVSCTKYSNIQIKRKKCITSILSISGLILSIITFCLNFNASHYYLDKSTPIICKSNMATSAKNLQSIASRRKYHTNNHSGIIPTGLRACLGVVMQLK